MTEAAASLDRGPRAHDHGLAPTEEASYRLGALAAWTVSVCAVHCVIVSAAGLLPLAGLGWFASVWFDWTMVAIAALFGTVGLGISYARIHRDALPGLVFLGGLAVLSTAHLFFEGEAVPHTLLVVAGAAVTFTAGRMNHSRVHACERCHPHPHR